MIDARLCILEHLQSVQYHLESRIAVSVDVNLVPRVPKRRCELLE